mmetsp:Transcript_40828/g.71772  ORF Transcript_40828/g.71772 Transcript_40828/m.71772 type:complete len:570 (+) Transcript_40828:98-1807(+)
MVMFNVPRPTFASWRKSTVTAACQSPSDAPPLSSQQPASNNNNEEVSAMAMAPPTSPQDDSPIESRQDVPSSPNNNHSCPLRLGSFNFDNPDTNTSNAHGQTSPQTHTLSFPPLFHEADDMLNLSLLIYILAETRDLARNGGLNNPAQSMRILDLPLPLDTALKIMATEGESLKEALDDGKHEATLSALESLLGRQRERMVVAAQEEKKAEAGASKKSDMFGWMTKFPLSKTSSGEGSKHQQEMEYSVITAVGDLKSNDELVYAVGVNPVEERITVIFRGSVTNNDFMTDAKISIVRAPDPRKFSGTESEDSPLGIHQGFYEYLFGKSNRNQSKYVEIMNHIDQLLDDNPTRKKYKLYITGHSLGGALATLFGFYAAASSSLPLPVTVVSVASPRVGNIDFARAFVEMESQGKLRHLRIANHKDPVTLGPTVSSKRALALSAKAFSPLGYLALMVTGIGEGGDEEVYYHTGMKMKLFKNVTAVGSQRCVLSYSGHTIISGSKKPVAIDKEDMAEIEQSNKRKKKESSSELPMVSYHYGTCYSERMALVESDLKGLTLNNLYREKAAGMP